MQLFVFAKFHAAPHREAALEAALLGISERTRQEPGCLSNEVFRSVFDPQTYFIQSTFSSDAAFEEHIAAPHTLAFTGQVVELIDQPYTVARTERLGHVLAAA